MGEARLGVQVDDFMVYVEGDTPELVAQGVAFLFVLTCSSARRVGVLRPRTMGLPAPAVSPLLAAEPAPATMFVVELIYR